MVCLLLFASFLSAVVAQPKVDPIGPQSVVGQRNFVFNDSKRNRTIATYVWYPANPRSKVTVIGNPGPFVPVKAALNAELSVRPKKYPLVLLSHGSGGKAEKLFWLASSLVNAEMMVVGVDHPGNMTRDNSAMGLLRPWVRAQDLSYALDEVLKNKIFSSHIDLTRIYAIGHSAGGTTVLLLAGAKFSASKFSSPIPNCLTSKDPYVIQLCKDIAAIDLHSFSKAEVEGSYSDARVSAVVALDPGFAKSFDPASFNNTKERVLVIGADKQPAPEDEIYSKEFKSLLPSGSFELLPGSIHMTFLQPCKQGIENEDAELKELCIDNSKRVEMQKKAATRSIDFLIKHSHSKL